MKHESRNCGVPYPIYPPYQGLDMMSYNQIPPFNPMSPYGPIPFTANLGMSPNGIANDFENKINSLTEQVNSLDKRVTALESGTLSTNNYSSSNYQMM